MRVYRTMLLAITGAILISTTVQARIRGHRPVRQMDRDEYSQSGFQLYAGFGGQGYQIEDNYYDYLGDRGSDGMFFLGAAVGLADELSLFLEGAGSQHETDIGDVTFGYTHIGLKVAPITGRDRSWQPYAKISAGAMFLYENDNNHDGWYHRSRDGYAGPSVALGIGVDKFFSRHAALYGEAGVMMGRFDTRIIDGREHDLADNIGVTSARLQFGLRIKL